MSTDVTHPAIAANLNSIKFAMAKDRESWLALYRDDAIICDPVGKSMLDPIGEGHKGKAAIAEFFDNVIATANVKLVPGEHRIGGDRSCAVPMQALNDLGEGVITTVDMITVYQVDEEGLIASMHAYWDWSALEKELMAIMG